MAGKTTLTLPLLRLGRLQLDPALRARPAGSASSGLVVTATVAVPDTPVDRSYTWDVAWADAAREASELGADQRTARALAAGAGQPVAGGTRVVVAAHGEVLLARWLPYGTGAGSVRVGPLPHLLEVAGAAARRPAYVVVLADRDGADIVVHASGDQAPAEPFPAGRRPGAQGDPHPGRPPGQLHGERHLTDREPESGGRQNAEFIAGRVSQAAESVGAHVVLGAGDQHILDAVAGHLPDSLGPVTAIAGDREPDGGDDHLSAAIGAALDEITAAAISAVGDLVAARAGETGPAAVRGIQAVADQLAEQQVAVLLVASDVARDADAGSSYRIGSRPTEFLVGQQDTGTEVPLADGLVWAALHQDAIIVLLPERAGPLAGQPAAALLRRGPAA
jgi:Bacterial archaeo-eukaryotic release factor family 2